MSDLKGKSILLISPKTFGYEELIKKKLQELGSEVVYFDDRPSVSNMSKIVIRLAPFLARLKIRSYFSSITKLVSGNEFDYILCIKQECYPRDLLEKLFSEHKDSKKIFYTWDSFRNSRNALNNLNLFDRCFTFDDDDARKFGISHRPLFYFDELARINTSVLKYDISFVGSLHKHRYTFIKKLIFNLPSETNSFFYLYVPSHFLFYLRKIFLFPYYGLSSKDEFNFETMPKDKLSNIFHSSSTIIDFSHHNQSGLTMRSIEALGAKKKLVTNNVKIKNYDFYNENNIYILEGDNYFIPPEFYQSSYVEVEFSIYNRYSIEGWIKEIFDL